jgi:hypothetical protein
MPGLTDTAGVIVKNGNTIFVVHNYTPVRTLETRAQDGGVGVRVFETVVVDSEGTCGG